MTTTPGFIDLRAGPSAACKRAATLLWWLSFGALAANASGFAWPVLVAACFLLAVLHPGSARAFPRSGPLRLHSNGAARFRCAECRWRPPSLLSRRILVLPLQCPDGVRNVLVCAALNDPAAFRKLLVWSRFPPDEAVLQPRPSTAT